MVGGDDIKGIFAYSAHWGCNQIYCEIFLYDCSNGKIMLCYRFHSNLSKDVAIF